MRLFNNKNIIKTHRRRNCKQCLTNPQSGGCSLPFRKQSLIRKWNNVFNKPILFKCGYLKRF